MRHDQLHNQPRRSSSRTIVRRWEDVPDFQNECEEQEYWRTHDLAADLFGRRPADADEAVILARARARRAQQARPAAG